MTVGEGGIGVRVVREARGRVTGDGVELAYGFWPGRGMPIVAVHALTTSYKTFVGIGERLAGRRPLFAPDLRGRGDSDKPTGPYGLTVHASDLAAAMRAIGIGPAVVVGHSMGAYVATALAAEHPDLVAGVVLLDGGHPPDLPPGLDPDTHLDQILGPVIDRLHQNFASLDEYLDAWRRLPTFAGRAGKPVWGAWVESYLTYDLGRFNGNLRPKASEAGARADFADMGDQRAAEYRLRAITVPVMTIRAESGLAPDQPPVLSEAAMARVRDCCGDGLVDHVVAETNHYTIALAEPGASTVAQLLVDFATDCGV
ncbi:MAG: alpha/beta fold hydrolase [Acidimicrobiia bacterium]